jgi:hypothetical protein
MSNGLVYRIYADTVCRHKMDDRPFLVIDLLNLQDSDLTHLVCFSKFRLKVEEAIAAATKLLEQQVAADLNHLASSPPAVTGSTPIAAETDARVLEATQQLEAAPPEDIPQVQPEAISSLSQPEATLGQAAIPVDIASVEIELEEEEVKATREERDGFYRLRSLLWREVNPDRLTLRATQHYCKVLLDGNRLQPICTFYFGRDTQGGSSQAAIGIPYLKGEGEDRILLETLDQLSEYWERLAVLLHDYESRSALPQVFPRSTPTQLEAQEYPYSYQNRTPVEGNHNFAAPLPF